MKVIHVLNELCPSGAEVMLKLAAPIWHTEGLELSIVACADEVGAFANVLRKVGYEIFECRRQRGIASLNFLRNLSDIFRASEAEVVHIHTESQCLLIALAARMAGVPRIIRTVHNNFPYTGYMKRQKSFERHVIKWLGISFVSIGESVSSTELVSFGNRTVRIENWIDSDHFRPPSSEERRAARAELGLDDNTHLLTSVGNGSDIKNYAAIIQSLPAFSGSDLLYLQVGNKHPAGIDRELVKALGLEQEVRFVGPKSDVRKYLWAADTFVMPSLREGNSLAAAEALSVGLPCIFSRVPGLRDWAKSPLNIFWAESPDASDITKALANRFEQASQRVARNDTDFVRELASPRRGAMAYLSVYQDI